MDPQRAADAIGEELETALQDEEIGLSGAHVRSVTAPADLGADRTFRIVIAMPGSPDHNVRLPVPLAMGYLADEEAAVDEWKTWVAALARRLAP